MNEYKRPRCKAIRAAILIGLAAFSLAACGGDSVSTPTPALPTDAFSATPSLIAPPEVEVVTANPNLLRVTDTATAFVPRRMTLPPSYTPTPTPSITPTRTPSHTPTATFTPTITPTRSAEELCSEDNFIANVSYSPDRIYRFDDWIDYFFYSRFPDTAILIIAENLDTGETLSYSVPGGFPAIASNFGAMFEETGYGLYEYAFELNTDTEQNVCPPITGQITFGASRSTSGTNQQTDTFLDRITGGAESTEEP